MNVCFYAHHDSDPELQARYRMKPIPMSEAKAWNERGYGIFHAVNRFKTERRIGWNLAKVRAWYTELDSGTKAEQRARISRSPLKPCEIVETKNGYHVYWYADDGVVAEDYRKVLERLVEFFGGDPNAKDIARVLRAPGFLHQKNPNDPFLVKHVYGVKPKRGTRTNSLGEHTETVFEHWNRRYTTARMLQAFPETAKEQAAKVVRPVRRRGASQPGSDAFEKIGSLSQEDLLSRLSGASEVSGDVFTFRPSSQGRKTILVNGQSTNNWIDPQGMIGSHDGGGPTVVQWLLWYRNNSRSTPDKAWAIDTVKRIHPELKEVRSV